MNYTLYLIGLNRLLTHRISTLLYTSIKNSDYKVCTFLTLPKHQYYPLIYTFNIYGSKKDDKIDILVDFDYKVKKYKDIIYLSYNELNIRYNKEQKHYWSITGKLLTYLEDVSPAFITGFLVENNKKEELALFREFFKI
ncbi:MAG: hypothetical protein SVN78_04625 [Deferribacterota bacterium]|nr:hypothetical protein [Deferribacterota bacterium]